MKKKFDIGDRVIYKPQNYIGTINGIDRYTNGYSILYDDGEECYVHENELEFENPKFAFLTRLQELLATFDAKLYANGDETYLELSAEMPNVEITWTGRDGLGYMRRPHIDFPLTAENVFDYDKE